MLSGYKGALGSGFLQELAVTAHCQSPSVRTDCGSADDDFAQRRMQTVVRKIGRLQSSGGEHA
jgi:hypothetical protein